MGAIGTFNHVVGLTAEIYLQDKGISKSKHPVLFEIQKGATAHNIRTDLRNDLAKIGAAAAFFTVVFPNPITLAVTVTLMGGSLFVNEAMKHTFWGATTASL